MISLLNLLKLLLILCGLTYLIIKLVRLLYWFKKKVDVLNRFPGPETHPIYGNLDLVFGSPEKIFKNIRQKMKSLWFYETGVVWLAFIPIICTINPNDIEAILSNSKHNSKSFIYETFHTWLGTGLLTSSGQKWQTRRKILTPAFHFSILQKFLPVFDKETNYLVKNLEKNVNQEIDLVPVVTNYTLNSICETAMGTSFQSMKDGDKYRKNIYKIGEYIVYRICRPWLLPNIVFYFSKIYWIMKKTARSLHKFSFKVIKNRKEELEKAISMGKNYDSYSNRKMMGMLDLLLLAQREGANIDDDGIREEVDTFMFEGHDTTSMSICFTLMLLANNKHYQDKVYEEIISVLGHNDRPSTYQNLQELKYMELCIKESLRLYPSVPLVSRLAGSNIPTQNGNVIPKGTAIVIFIYDLHRRPDLYPNPEEFDPERFLPENLLDKNPYAYIPFSAGSRNCIGQKFAILEIKTVLAGILRKYIVEPVDTPETLTLIQDIVIRPKDGIRVKFVKRKDVF